MEKYCGMEQELQPLPENGTLEKLSEKREFR